MANVIATNYKYVWQMLCQGTADGIATVVDVVNTQMLAGVMLKCGRCFGHLG